MVYLNHIQCLPAPNKHSQESLMDFIGANMDLSQDRKLELLFQNLKRKNIIEYRHSALDKSFFINNSPLCEMSTAQRQTIYASAALKLIEELVNQTQPSRPALIDNLITVSCTGYQTPGLELILLEKLRTKNTPFRYNLGAMGCYAGLVGLRLANNLIGNSYLLCLELCSLHFQAQPANFSNLVSNYLFGDGAALVELSQEQTKNSCFKLASFASQIIPHTQDKMSWLLSDKGFVMHLDPDVPNLIGQNIQACVKQWLAQSNLSVHEIDYWVIHPGSHAILKTVQQSLGLPPEALNNSLNILKSHGNMSSGTVFFILDDLLKEKNVCNKKVAMLAFGPGLTAEMALLEGI